MRWPDLRRSPHRSSPTTGRAFGPPGSAPVAFALDLLAKDLNLAGPRGVGAPIPQLETNRREVGEAIDAGLVTPT
jgi:hypothetical protein